MWKILLSLLGLRPTPEATYDLIPDQTGNVIWKGLDEGFIDVHLNRGSELPAVGDIVIRLESCSMGVSVRRESRYRIISEPMQKGETKAVYGVALFGTRHAEPQWFHAHNLRKHKRKPRIWWEFD